MLEHIIYNYLTVYTRKLYRPVMVRIEGRYALQQSLVPY